MPNDYIRRDAAISLIDQHCFESNYDAEWMENALRDLPAVGVVGVVRCSVCRLAVLKDTGNGKTSLWCPVNNGYRCYDELCNRGKLHGKT